MPNIATYIGIRYIETPTTANVVLPNNIPTAVAPVAMIASNFIKSLFNYDANFKVKTNISKSSLKDKIIKDSESYKDLAYIENTKSLLIK